MKHPPHEPSNRLMVPFSAVVLTGVAWLSQVAAANGAEAERRDSRQHDPIAAEAAVMQFQLPDELRIELVAAEPDVVDPVAMTFDADGRLWVVEMSDYPDGPPQEGPPLSRIRVLSDEDGDGRYTNPVTFADKLLFANGLLLWKDGLLVTTDGDVLYLRDTDADGKADEREVWFSGFKRDNPQLRANHPTLGVNNHIYIASGLRGGEVVAVRDEWADDAGPISLSSRDFRFDPLTGDYEAVSGAGQFGLCFDDFGNRFVCSNRNPCKHIVLEDRYLARNPNIAVSHVHHDVSPAAEESRLYPISQIWTTSNLHANQFTAACGVLIYRGDALSSQYHGNSFTCEPTSNLVHRDVLIPEGATFTSRPGREGVEFLATKDEWFRPVNLSHGPDGALYVVDMYRAVIEHPEFMPAELKSRPDLTDGRDRGRIYRIGPRASSEPASRKKPRLGSATNSQLVQRLASSNPWERDTAARLLLQRQDRSVATALTSLSESATSPATRVRALWLLDGLGALTRDHVATALHDEHPRVREQALLLAERRFTNDSPFRSRCVELLLAPDSDGRLVFQAALSAGGFPPSDELVAALAEVVARQPGDQWLRAAVASSVRDSMADLLGRVVDHWNDPQNRSPAEGDRTSAQVLLVEEYAAMIPPGGWQQATAMLSRILDGHEGSADAASLASHRLAFALLRGLARGQRRAGTRLANLQHSAMTDAFDAAKAMATDRNLSAAARIQAIQLLGEAPADLAGPVLADLVTGEQEQDVTLAAIESAGRCDDPRVTEMLLNDFRHRTPRVRSAVLAALTTSDRLARLLDRIEAGEILPGDVGPAIRPRLDRISNPDVQARAKRLLITEAEADREKVIARYQPALSLPPDLQRGRAVFTKTCATCHRVGDVGVNVGADISDTRAKTPEQLLANILDPNKAVDGNHFGYTLIDTQGRVYTGIITTETSSSITLRQPEGKEVTLLRREIEELVSTGKSLMPVGLEKDIDLQQMADLIGFLKNWRYLDGAVPQEVIAPVRGELESSTSD